MLRLGWGRRLSLLDPQLRVCGVSGPRVADVSIMPILPAANINAPAIIIVQKAADPIRAGPR